VPARLGPNEQVRALQGPLNLIREPVITHRNEPF
jgi:hypothetical protein